MPASPVAPAFTAAALLTAPSLAQAENPQVVYVHFDEIVLEACEEDDPTQNCIDDDYDWSMDLPPPPITFNPFIDSPKRRAEIVRAMRTIFAAYDIVFTDIRPADDVEYDMIVLGMSDPPPYIPTPDLSPPGWLAFPNDAPDCGDTRGGQTFVAWWDDDENNPMLGNGAFTVQALPTGWGLETVTGSAMMDFSRWLEPIDDGCHPIEPLPVLCPEQTTPHCPDDPDHQNSHLEILEILGPAVPDMEGPTVEITNPADGAVMPATLDLELSVVDNRSPQLINLLFAIDGGDPISANQQVAGEMSFPVENLAEGEHTIVVEAMDEDENVGQDEVTFTVGQPDDTETDDGATGGSGSGDTDSDGGGATGDSSKSGCGCTAAPASAAPLLLLPLFFRMRRAC